MYELFICMEMGEKTDKLILDKIYKELVELGQSNPYFRRVNRPGLANVLITDQIDLARQSWTQERNTVVFVITPTTLHPARPVKQVPENVYCFRWDKEGRTPRLVRHLLIILHFHLR